MIAFLQYLFAFAVSLDLPTAERPAFDAGGILIALAVFAGAAAVAGCWLRSAVARAPGEAVRVLAGVANVGRLAALGSFWAVAQVHGGCRVAETLGIQSWVLVPHFVRLAPFFLMLAMVRAAVHHAGTALAERPPSLVRSLLLDAKLALLPVAPLFALAVFADVSGRADRTTAWGRAWVDYGGLPSIRSFVGLGIAFAVLLALPAILRRAWRCRPLPAGPLRDRLEAYAQRTGFRAREILVWPTGGEHINAAVVGLFPRFRYVFFTDGLLATLAPDEIEAVFAHEAGHARRGHLPLFLGYTSLLGLAGFLPGVVLGPLEANVAPLPFAVRAMLVVFVWFGLVFGWISRRFEQEADVYGLETLRARGAPGDASASAQDPRDALASGDTAEVADTADAEALRPRGNTSDEHPFARALERIAEAAGGIREMTGWRHYSIAERVEFVHRYLADGAVRATFRRQIGAIRGALIVLLAAAIGAAALRVPADLRDARTRGMLEDLAGALAAESPQARSEHFARAAQAAARSGRTEAALRWYAAAAPRAAATALHAASGSEPRIAPDVLRDWAALLASSGRPLGAAAALRAASR